MKRLFAAITLAGLSACVQSRTPEMVVEQFMWNYTKAWNQHDSATIARDFYRTGPSVEEQTQNLERGFGSWRVAWGEINRLQGMDESKNETFQVARPSVAIPGFSGSDGAVFTFYARPVDGQKRRYGAAGGTYISVVEFAPKVRGFSVHVFGASANPRSPHFMDQSPLFARGEFKPAWLALEDIKANLESSYHPGEEKNKL